MMNCKSFNFYYFCSIHLNCEFIASKAYEELVGDHIVTMTTRSAARGEPTSISTNSRCYHQSFLPRTIREMRGLASNN